ncbi:NAD(+) diphosphatase [Pontibacter sp. 172403-2]|uniref:NAD(+) diphosphatase n=1 Tax=Pontibacter rufus TaxID=2791028 RepID=UPI0018AFE291|nr:NAD(+) diphosphatase [Pontibacter sp. 172403-2]MBF9255042.1 NAD(+) diphosphatase [Pontibacter sp. 172403-2]
MNYFSHNPLNRDFEARTDAAQQTHLWNHPQARIILIHDSLNLFVQQEDSITAVLLPREEAEVLEPVAKAKVFLGVADEVPYFALGFEKHPDVLAKYPKTASYLFRDLKDVALQLPQEQSAILAYARAMVHWHLGHHFCANCGAPTYNIEAGHVRQCSNADCGKLHFPRTDTAVIMLISEGDACLLARQATWPKSRYATLAGFLEPGETLEQAVAREAMEETGVQLASITYHSSQPWPFPASVMAGFMATASSRSLAVNYNEMEDARWFTRQEIADGLQQGTFLLPPQVSISYRLIRDWYNAAPGHQLEEVMQGLPERNL